VTDERRTGPGVLLRSATDVMANALKSGPKQRAELEVRYSADGSVMGTATWTREGGFAFHADVLKNFAAKGGGYASIRVTRSW
jgi:hypothetical protein